jgi:hypothetical protein
MQFSVVFLHNITFDRLRHRDADLGANLFFLEVEDD